MNCCNMLLLVPVVGELYGKPLLLGNVRTGTGVEEKMMKC